MARASENQAESAVSPSVSQPGNAQTGSTPALQITPGLSGRTAELLAPPVQQFLAHLVSRYHACVDELLAARDQRQLRIDAGERPDFLEETQSLRADEWRVAPPPQEVADRRTEITGPPERKMIINALNSGAQVYMSDFEDSSAPSWHLMVEGQLNLMDAVRRQIDFTADNGKSYALQDRCAVLMVRPRGLHLRENHVLWNGEPIPASLFDFALYLFHNHEALAAAGSRPYFYLPKLEHYLEARWWAEVIDSAEQYLGLAPGTVRVTVLIETLPAVFQMDEILYELRHRILGLNCGRWDYIFSYIKTFRAYPEHKLPDRSALTMERGFLRAYSRLLIYTCHRRGAHAMGGMAAQIPINNDTSANELALAKVRADKAREAQDGHDGTWVAHPALEKLARAEFDAVMPGPNQKQRQELTGPVDRDALTAPMCGEVTAEGVRNNIRVALVYIANWLQGSGCVPINHLMEDAATAEIARAQLWQWVQHGPTTLSDGQVLSTESYPLWQQHAVATLSDELPAVALEQADGLLQQLVLSPRLANFFTIPAYPLLLAATDGA